MSLKTTETGDVNSLNNIKNAVLLNDGISN